MNIDERLEFMARNIESLHEAVFENTRQIAELAKRQAKTDEQLARTGEQLQGLVQTASQLLRGWAEHERRIERLEGGEA